MTLICLQIDGKLQVIVGLTFDTVTKNFIVTTQFVEIDQFKNFVCLPGSTHYTFTKAILRNLPPHNIDCSNVQFWMNLIEAILQVVTVKNFWDLILLLQVDTNFTTRRAINICHLLSSWQNHSWRQKSGNWESSCCNTNPHNHPNRIVRKPRCDPENFPNSEQRGKSKLRPSSESHGHLH